VAATACAYAFHIPCPMDPVLLLAAHGLLHPASVSSNDLSALVQHSFSIHQAQTHHLDQLVHIEQSAWQHHGLAASLHELNNRLSNYPRGQWVAIVDGKVVGVMYTQRIASRDVLFSSSYSTQSSLHSDNGPVLQLLSVAVLPEYASLQISRALRDFNLRLAKMQTDIIEVVAMTRCSSSSNSLEEYFKKVNTASDPTLQFHVSGGAVVVNAVANYRTDDTNFGYAVMIRYDLGKSISKLSNVDLHQQHVSGKEFVTADEICAIINDVCTKQFIVNESFLHSPFMDLGLDSLRIMEFRARLIKSVGVEGVDIPHSVVFDYPSPAKLLQFLNNTSPAVNAGNSGPKNSFSSDILICGVSCRFPGGANNPHSFFNMLREGCSMIQPKPSIWNSCTKIPTVGMLDENVAASFDPTFFNISLAEAQQMDPHQRLVLEVCYEAMLEAQVLQDRDRLKIGVFVGFCNNEWIANHRNGTKKPEVTAYTGICSAQSAAANRVSFVLGLTGPSMVVDTACSSSLSALHVALQSLRTGDCEVAVVAAADLLLSPYSIKVHI
jgi:hypothetical protein